MGIAGWENRIISLPNIDGANLELAIGLGCAERNRCRQTKHSEEKDVIGHHTAARDCVCASEPERAVFVAQKSHGLHYAAEEARDQITNALTPNINRIEVVL